jgi:hypothetical protein
MCVFTLQMPMIEHVSSHVYAHMHMFGFRRVVKNNCKCSCASPKCHWASNHLRWWMKIFGQIASKMQLPLWLGARWHLLQRICLCNLSSMTKQCCNGQMCHLWIKLVVNLIINMHIFYLWFNPINNPKEMKFYILKNRFDTIFVPSSFTNSRYKLSWQVAKLKNEGKFRCQRHMWKVRCQETNKVKWRRKLHSFIHASIYVMWMKKDSKPYFHCSLGGGWPIHWGLVRVTTELFKCGNLFCLFWVSSELEP